jgi:uncharacterized circularly permuted ATP-grasp superfamily protein
MPSVATWWCGEKAALAWVAEHLSGLVIKPAFPAPGVQPIFGVRLSEAERNELLDRMRAAGAVISSTEMIIYELLRSSGSPAFKELLPYLR